MLVVGGEFSSHLRLVNGRSFEQALNQRIDIDSALEVRVRHCGGDRLSTGLSDSSHYCSSGTRITHSPSSSNSSQNAIGVSQSVTIMSILLRGQVRKLDTQFILV